MWHWEHEGGRSVRWALPVLGVILALVAGSVQAQLRCTMPNGMKITQQLGSCPRGALAAEKLDGTPVPLEQAQPTAAAPSSVKPAPAVQPKAAAPALGQESSGLSFGGWLVVGLLAFGLVAAVKGSMGTSGPVRYCTSCGHEGRGRTRTRGSLLIEIVLWLCFLIPGLIYSIWRQSSKHKVCASCGASSLVPVGSPVARAAKRELAEPDNEVSGPAAHAVESWEGSFYEVMTQRSAKKSVRIRYRDGGGAVLERVVDIKAFEPEGRDSLVLGWCHLRNANRTFRFDRMDRVIDVETGEVIPDLQAVLNAEWDASPEPVLDALFARHRDLLRMLLFAAKADGAMRAAEVAVIVRHCVELTGDDRIDVGLVKDLLGSVDVPTITGFIRAYNRLRREVPRDAQRAAQACREIVATQGSVHPAEQAMLDVLDRPLPEASAPSSGSRVAA